MNIRFTKNKREKKQLSTYRLDTIYFRFIAPAGGSMEALKNVAEALQARAFIVINGERFTETQKIISGEHKNELFKCINKAMRGLPYDD
jgi:hypothetical protein